MTTIATIEELRARIQKRESAPAQSPTSDLNPTTAVAEENPSFLSLLNSTPMQREIAKALPANTLSVDRLVRMVQTLFRRDFRLQQCEPYSLMGAVMQAAELGLVPGFMGQAFIDTMTVPGEDRGKGWLYEAQLIPGYRGLIKLMMRSGEVASIVSRVVTDLEIAQERFDLYYEGAGDTLIHRPILVGQRGNPALVYCLVRMKSGSFHVEPVFADEVLQIRERALMRVSDQNDGGPWFTHEEQMWRKTGIRRAAKYLDITVEALETAIRLDELAENRQSQELRRKVLDGQGADLPDLSARTDSANTNAAPAAGSKDRNGDGEAAQQ